MTSESPMEAVIANWPVNPNDYVEYALWFIKDEGDDGWYDLNNYVKDAMAKIGYDIRKHQSLTLSERYTIAAGLLALAAKHAGKTPFERWLEKAYPQGVSMRERDLMEEAWEATQRG